MRVRDAMTTSVKTIAPEASLKEAAAVFDAHRIGGSPVVDTEGRVLGVISEADILLKEQAESPRGALRRLLHPRRTSALAAKAEARTVEDAMTEPAITCEAGWPISEVAKLMLEHGVNRLPVVENGRLVGIVTRHDLVRAFARSDWEIEQDIREEALRGLALIEELELRVREGEVTLRGEVDSTYDAEALPDIIRRVPGVVAVDSELIAWDVEKQQKVSVTAHRD